MQFLTLEERNKLNVLLMENSYIKKADATVFQALLVTCGLDKYSKSIKLDQELAYLIPQLCMVLSESEIDIELGIEAEFGIKLTRKPGLIVFLFNMFLAPDLYQITDELESLIDRIIKKWCAYQDSNKDAYIEKSENPSVRKIEELLNQKRQALSKEKFEESYQIDRSIIIDFDLKKVIIEFKKVIEYQGAFSFAIGGDQRIIGEYIVERIKKELELTTKRTSEYFEIQFHRSKTLKSLKDELTSKFHSYLSMGYSENHLDIDILAVVWNYDIPQKTMQKLAQDFWGEMYEDMSTALFNQNRCLVLIWANLNKRPINGFNVLSTPERFELIDLNSWFKCQLRQIGVPEIVINRCLEQLKAQGGHLGSTYRVMNNILRELQGSYKENG